MLFNRFILFILYYRLLISFRILCFLYHYDKKFNIIDEPEYKSDKILETKFFNILEHYIQKNILSNVFSQRLSHTSS